METEKKTEENGKKRKKTERIGSDTVLVIAKSRINCWNNKVRWVILAVRTVRKTDLTVSKKTYPAFSGHLVSEILWDL